MNKCSLFGHTWGHKYDDERFLTPEVWTCERCGIVTQDWVEPPKWPWLLGYPL